MTTLVPSEGSSGGPSRGDRTVAELLGELVDETGTLVRQEVKLATAEMSAKVSYAGRQVAFIAFGALLGVVALLALLAALVLGLATMIALWKSALLVGIVAGIVAALLAFKGVAGLRDMSMLPKQTIKSLKENRQWVEQQVR
jgi:hypothetical protein